MMIQYELFMYYIANIYDCIYWFTVIFLLNNNQSTPTHLIVISLLINLNFYFTLLLPFQ